MHPGSGKTTVPGTSRGWTQEPAPIPLNGAKVCGPSSRAARGRGYVLVAAAAAVVLILGILGLCLDLGRMLVAKNELQTYSDAAAIAAANRLNGTPGGIANAIAEATTNTNKWYFGLITVTAVSVDFAPAPTGPWAGNPSSAAGYRFARVTAQANVPTYFAPALGQGLTAAVRATAVAGQQYLAQLGDGAFPFSPDAHAPTDPSGNYGFIKGEMYTLRWDPVGKSECKKGGGLISKSGHCLAGCPGDRNAPGFVPGSANNGERGYINLGGSGAGFLREAVLGSVDVEPIRVGDVMDNVSGNKQSVVGAIMERINQDTNTTTARYYTAPAAGVGLEPPGRTYYDLDPPGAPPAEPPRGNGRRIVTVPVNNPANDQVIGFADFFLGLDPCNLGASGGNPQPCCAEYIGPSTLLPGAGGAPAGSGSLSAYRILLFQ